MNFQPKGRVYLVGAGPGDPELLTLKAARVLREADVVLHDDLVSAEILALIPRTANVISVGKRCGSARVTQDEINVLMVSYATLGRSVVRLKSGDPMLFGRAGEEMETLRAAGVDFEVVPGISTAFAAAAALQASLTDRRKAGRVTFSTGQHAPGAHDQGSTHVIYMPGSNYALLAQQLQREGFSPNTPCAIVSAVSLENQTIQRTTVGDLPSLGPRSTPAILLVGEVLESEVAMFAGLSRNSLNQSAVPRTV